MEPGTRAWQKVKAQPPLQVATVPSEGAMQGSSGPCDSVSGSPSSSFPSVPQPLSCQKEALVALEARHASKYHSGPTPGLFLREAGLSEEFRSGGGDSEGLESRLAGLDEESNSESFAVIKGWPDTFLPGADRVLEFMGAHCVLPQSGLLETEKGGTGATLWIAGPERNELNTNSLESQANSPEHRTA